MKSQSEWLKLVAVSEFHQKVSNIFDDVCSTIKFESEKLKKNKEEKIQQNLIEA